MADVKSLTFWRNWYDGARFLPDEMRLAWYDSVLDFAFEGKEPDIPKDGDLLAAMRFKAVCDVRATITKSRRLAKNGSKGGASKSKREANAKQIESKVQASKNIEDRSKNLEEQECVITRARKGVITKMKRLLGRVAPTIEDATPEAVREFEKGMDELNWTAKGRDGEVYDVTPKNMIHVLRGWCKQYQTNSAKKISGARGAPEMSDPVLAFGMAR